MTLQFSETSPGVHMASWEDTSKGVFRTAVIIESLEKFTLYIDSDAVAVDLENFDKAVERANALAKSGSSRRLTQIAAGLVAVAVIGGAAVAAMSFTSDTSSVAIAAVTEPAKVAETTTYTNASPVKTVEPTTTTKPAPKKVAFKPKPQVPASTGSVTVETDETDNEIVASNNDTVTVTKPSQITTGSRIYSASNPALNGRTQVPAYGESFSAGKTVDAPETASLESEPVEIAPLPKKNPLWNDSEAAEPKKNEVAVVNPEPETKTEVASDEEETFPVARTADDLINDFMLKRTGKSTVKRKKPSLYSNSLTASQIKKAEEKAAKAKAKKIKAARIKAAKIKAAKIRAAKRRAAHRRASRRPRRVMRCMHGGCRWVKTGGYYDRQYRRHY